MHLRSNVFVGSTHLGVERRILDLGIDKDPQMVLDHEVLDIGVLVLLVDALDKVPASRVTLCQLAQLHAHVTA